MSKQELPHLVVFKGGTAFNSLLEPFRATFARSTYVVPVSDDGGSSREICRVFGGPSIGDLRSTLTRLSGDWCAETLAIKKLLEYRLSATDQEHAHEEWYQLLEDRHPLYEHISSQYRGLVRCFLCKFEAERLQKIDYRFDLRNGSIGNFFFTGARLVLGSLETAVFVYSSVARIAQETHVSPVIDTMDRLSITARLQNGMHIAGQDAISHPSQALSVDKQSALPLQAPIVELFYVNKYGDRFSPTLNHSIASSLDHCQGIIYGIGSLWTSIIPSLILEGIGEKIASTYAPKALLLNCCHDRETQHLTAYDFVMRLTEALNRFGQLKNEPTQYVTHLFAVEDGSIPLEESKIKKLGIALHKIPKDSSRLYTSPSGRHPVYDQQALLTSLTKIL